MPTSIALEKVEIRQPEHGQASSEEAAVVHLVITSPIGQFPVAIEVSPFSSLDEAVREARQQVKAFATELAVAADAASGH